MWRISRLYFTAALFASLQIVSAGASSAKPSQYVVSSPAVSESPSTARSGQTNPVIQLGKYFVDSLVRAKDGTVELYTNHRRCNEIRDKQRQYRLNIAKNTVTGTATSPKLKPNLGITYDEFIFLQQGKEDRGKLVNIIFMMAFAPNFVPYSFMFFPDMLPSPFAKRPVMDTTQPGHSIRRPLIASTDSFDEQTSSSIVYKYHDVLSRQRTHVVLSTLVELEKNAHTPSFLASLNPFGKTKVKQQMDELDQSNDQLAIFLTRSLSSPTMTNTNPIITSNKHSWMSASKAITTTTHPSSKDVGPHAVMKALHQVLYSKDTPPNKNDAQLVSLHKSILSGLDQLLSLSFAAPNSNTNSFLTPFLPKFITRGKVLNYLKQMEEADEFLVDSKISLDTLSLDALQATCQKRLLGGPDRSEQELRESLSTWLDCTVVIPRKRCKKASSSSVVASSIPNHATAAAAEGKRVSPLLYFNGNLARAALLCYNALEGARDSRNASYLPRLLFTGSLQK